MSSGCLGRREKKEKLMHLPILIVGHKYSPQQLLVLLLLSVGTEDAVLNERDLHETASISHFLIHKEGKEIHHYVKVMVP